MEFKHLGLNIHLYILHSIQELKTIKSWVRNDKNFQTTAKQVHDGQLHSMTFQSMSSYDENRIRIGDLSLYINKNMNGINILINYDIIYIKYLILSIRIV